MVGPIRTYTGYAPSAARTYVQQEAQQPAIKQPDTPSDSSAPSTGELIKTGLNGAKKAGLWILGGAAVVGGAIALFGTPPGWVILGATAVGAAGAGYAGYEVKKGIDQYQQAKEGGDHEGQLEAAEHIGENATYAVTGILPFARRIRLPKFGKSPNAGITDEAAELVETTSQAMKPHAKTLAAEYEAGKEAAIAEVTEVFAAHGQVSGRAKSPISTTNKLTNKVVKKKADIQTLDDARNAVGDGVGTRIVLSDTSEQGVQQTVNRLARAIESGELRVTEINNYRGPNGQPYFSEQHIARLEQAAARTGRSLKITEGSTLEKPSGYTGTHLDVVHKNGIRGEVQIRGRHVDYVAEVEHVPYDIRTDKTVPKIYDGIKGQIKGMSEPEFSAYNRYTDAYYKHARALELGNESTPPKLSDFGLDNYPQLSIEHLSFLRTQAKVLAAGDVSLGTATPFAQAINREDTTSHAN